MLTKGSPEARLAVLKFLAQPAFFVKDTGSKVSKIHSNCLLQSLERLMHAMMSAQ